jgi:hypothetical protein
MIMLHANAMKATSNKRQATTQQQHGGGLRSEMFLTVAAVGSNCTGLPSKQKSQNLQSENTDNITNLPSLPPHIIFSTHQLKSESDG